MNNHIILFDGVCNFCNSSINFLIKVDKEKKFRYAPLQSSIGQEMLKSNSLSQKDFTTFILIKGNEVFKRSNAILEITNHLIFPWKLFRIFRFIPQSARDRVYDLIAKNRYNWFGKREKCMIPTKEIKSLFLE